MTQALALRTRRTAAILLCALASIAAARAQTPVQPIYDVAAIKPNHSGSGSTSVHTQDRTYIATNLSLKDLLQQAFNINRSLISGLPGWAESASYDIDAKVLDLDPAYEKSIPDEVRRAMLRKLVEDRFHLKTHIETKTLPVYDLVIAKAGLKLTALPPEPPETPESKGKGASMNTHNSDLTATNVEMPGLAHYLTDRVQRTVIDQTGLTAHYNLKLKWTPDNYMVNGAPATNDDAPGIFTALEDQLGLKLQPGKGPVDTLVVDHIEVPSEN